MPKPPHPLWRASSAGDSHRHSSEPVSLRGCRSCRDSPLQLPWSVSEALMCLCWGPVGASWLCLPTYVIFMVAAPSKDCNSRESLRRFVSGFKTRSSQTCQIRKAAGGSILEVHFPSGLVKVSPERTPPPAFISLMACILESNLVSFGKQRHSLLRFRLNLEGGSQQKAGEVLLMYTACSISWILLLVAIGMRRLLIWNHSSSEAMFKLLCWIFAVYLHQLWNQGLSKKYSSNVFPIKGGCTNLKNVIPKALATKEQGHLSITLHHPLPKLVKYNCYLSFQEESWETQKKCGRDSYPGKAIVIIVMWTHIWKSSSWFVTNNLWHHFQDHLFKIWWPKCVFIQQPSNTLFQIRISGTRVPACNFNIKHNTIFYSVSSSLHPLPSRCILHLTWEVLEISETVPKAFQMTSELPPPVMTWLWSAHRKHHSWKA